MAKTKLDKFIDENRLEGLEIIASNSKKYVVYKNGEKTTYKVKKWEEWGNTIINENMEFLRDQLRFARETEDIEMWGKLFFAILKYFKAELRSKDGADEVDEAKRPVVLLPEQMALVQPEEEIKNIENIENTIEGEKTNENQENKNTEETI